MEQIGLVNCFWNRPLFLDSLSHPRAHLSKLDRPLCHKALVSQLPSLASLCYSSQLLKHLPNSKKRPFGNLQSFHFSFRELCWAESFAEVNSSLLVELSLVVLHRAFVQ